MVSQANKRRIVDGLTVLMLAHTAYQHSWKPNRAAQQKMTWAGEAHGAFVNGYVDPAHVSCFEQMADRKLDMAMRFTNFLELSSGKPFPTEEARAMQKRGGILYLVLEPGSGRRPFDPTFPTRNIIAGKYDAELQSFAEATLDYGGPVLLTFRPQLDSHVTAEEVKDVYLKVRRTLLGEAENISAGRQVRQLIFSDKAKNITWAWSVNLDDRKTWENPPASNEFDAVAVTAYEEAGLKKLEANIDNLKKLGKPIIVEYGTSAAPSKKGDFLKAAAAKFKMWGIAAAIYFNVSQVEGSTLKPWALSDKADQDAYRTAMAGGAPPIPPIETIDCSKIEGRYQNAADGDRIAELKKTVEKADAAFETKGKVPLEFLSDTKIKLNRAYRELYNLTGDEGYLIKSRDALEELLQHPIPNISFGTAEHPYVDKYFEVRLELMDTYFLIDKSAAFREYTKITGELKSKAVLHAQHVEGHSVPGYEGRANLASGEASQNNLAHAKEQFIAVSKWAKDESQQSRLTLLWRNENKKDLLFLEAKANLGLGQIALIQKDYPEALRRFSQVLAHPESGSEDGFMDRGFEALLYAMDACLESSDTGGLEKAKVLENAKALFRQQLPWNRLNDYTDLKKALELEQINLNDKYADLWQAILAGLSQLSFVNDNADHKNMLDRIRDFSENK